MANTALILHTEVAELSDIQTAAAHRHNVNGNTYFSPEYVSFRKALADLFGNICPDHREPCHYDLTRFLYSSIKPFGQDETGSECASRLFTGLDKNYTLFQDEVTFIQRNIDTLRKLFKENFPNQKITHVSLGCGPHSSVEFKDVPLARAIGASHYIAVDINEHYAKTALEITKDRMPNVSSAALCADFTKPFDLRGMVPKGSIVVMSLLGDTIGQHPILHEGSQLSLSNSVPLCALLKNIGKATKHKAMLLATLDTETCGDAAVAKYHGEEMIRLMRTLWATAKEVTQDSKFDLTVFKFRADFDPKDSAIKFVHTASDDTNLTIEGTRFDIPEGTKIIIGCSQKTKPSSLLKTCKKAGWTSIPELDKLNHSNTVRLLGLTGKNLMLKKPALV